MATPLETGLLQFVDLRGHEAISDVFEFNIDAISASADIESAEILGSSVTVEIKTQASTRFLNGIATKFSYIGPDGNTNSRFKYRLRVNSWLYLASKSRDCRIYQELTPPDLIKEVLAKFGMPLEMKLVEKYPTIPYIVQWNESDLDFVKRIAERYGLYWYVRHSANDHAIVFCDGVNPTLPEYDTIEFLAPTKRNLDQDEYVFELELHHEVQSGKYVTRSHDHRNPNAKLEQQDLFRNNHGHDALEVFEWEGNYVERSAGQSQTRVRREQMQLAYQAITANSNVRGIAPGYCFKLKKHPRAKCNIEYLIIGATYHFHENPQTTREDGEPTTWRLNFVVRPCNDRYYPPRVTSWPKIGLQTATVVGPVGEQIWTNDLGEIKIAYHWDRRASYSERDTKWIPVSEAWIGAGNGSKLLPRIGDSVVVDHLDGDPDRPIVIGRAHDQSHIPANFSKTGGLPANHALAGMRSQELGGLRYNQLLFDDTPGEIRTQLESEHAKSQLNLGYLTHPRDGHAQARGEGFELRSDAWGVMRAAKGLLLTTEAQQGGEGLALSRKQLVSLLEATHKLAKDVADFATKNLGNSSDQKPQELLWQSMRDWGNGSNAEEGDHGGAPVFAVSSRAGIAFGTPKSTTIATGQHVEIVSAQNQHLTAGQNLNMHAREAISQFALNGGIKSIAYKGKHITQAQDDDVQIVADKSVQISASGDNVMISANKHVTLTSGGGYIRIAGGNIEIHCPGTVSIKGSNYEFTGPTSMTDAQIKFESKLKLFNEYFHIVDQKTGKKLQDIPYRLHIPSTGENADGNTETLGRTLLKHTGDKPDELQLHYTGDEEVNHGW